MVMGWYIGRVCDVGGGKGRRGAWRGAEGRGEGKAIRGSFE